MKALKQDPEAALNSDTLKLTITSAPTWSQNYTLCLMSKAASETQQSFLKAKIRQTANTKVRRQRERKRSKVINTTQPLSSPLSCSECAFVTAAYNHSPDQSMTTCQAGIISKPRHGQRCDSRGWTAWQPNNLTMYVHAQQERFADTQLWHKTVLSLTLRFIVFFNILHNPLTTLPLFSSPPWCRHTLFNDSTQIVRHCPSFFLLWQSHIEMTLPAAI